MDTSQFDRITIGQLRQAGGLKWRAFPDCIGAFVAEMDFGVAAPIRQALHDAVEAGQLGYLISAYLESLLSGTNGQLRGATGDLRLDGFGNVVRQPAWATFSGGQPVPLGN